MNERFSCLDVAQLEQTAQPKRWVWDGYLAAGQITLFTSVWKSGKTTLLSHLLAQRKSGGTLAGRAVAAGVSAIVTEEPASLWHERHAHLGFGPRDCFFCRPFVGVPSQADWLQFIDVIKGQKLTRGLDLVIIDPLAYFLPAGEASHARLFLEALTPLHLLTQEGMAVLLVHHPRKNRAAEGMMARGSGMLPSFADILIEMYRVNSADLKDRRRRLVALSRDAATPGSLVIELNAEGTGYPMVEEAIDDDFRPSWIPLRMVLENAKEEMTRQEIGKAWPNSFPAPNSNTLWRWLSHAVNSGLIQRIGTGIRAEPFRYFLTEKAAFWQARSAEPSATPNLDAWLKRWQEMYPAPPEWEEEGDDSIRGNDLEAEA